MTEKFVRNNWEKALSKVKNGEELSGIIDFGFSDPDIVTLANLHKAGKFKEKIEELLTDCNFHSECEALKNGDYQSVIDEYSGTNESVKLVCASLLEGKTLSEAIEICESADLDEDKVHALFKFLGLDSTPENFDRVSVVSYNDNMYEIDGVEFLVCTDDEADEEFETAIDNFIDDVGIEGFTPSAQEYILENCIDEDPIIDFYQDSTRSYAEDINTETDPITIEVEGPDGEPVEVECTNRLFKECIENDIISEDDFSVEDFDADGEYVGDEDLVELYCDHFDNPTVQGYDDAYDWLKWNFGADYAAKFVKDQCSLDVELQPAACPRHASHREHPH